MGVECPACGENIVETTQTFDFGCQTEDNFYNRHFDQAHLEFVYTTVNRAGDGFEITAKILTCPECGDRFCPNTIGNPEMHRPPQPLKTRNDRRGTYPGCPICKWYPFIEFESFGSEYSEQLFREKLIDHLTDAGLKSDRVEFEGQELVGGDEWLPLDERTEQVGRMMQSDLVMNVDGTPLTRFELKQWGCNWNYYQFRNADPFVTPREVRDAAKMDGFVVVIVANDDYLHYMDAQRIIDAYESEKTDSDGDRLVYDSPDHQGNKRWRLDSSAKWNVFGVKPDDLAADLIARIKEGDA